MKIRKLVEMNLLMKMFRYMKFSREKGRTKGEQLFVRYLNKWLVCQFCTVDCWNIYFGKKCNFTLNIGRRRIVSKNIRKIYL